MRQDLFEWQLSETCSRHLTLPKPPSPWNTLPLTNKISTKPTCPKIFTYVTKNIYRIKLHSLQVSCHQFYKIKERIAVAEERQRWIFSTMPLKPTVKKPNTCKYSVCCVQFWSTLLWVAETRRSQWKFFIHCQDWPDSWLSCLPKNLSSLMFWLQSEHDKNISVSKALAYRHFHT